MLTSGEDLVEALFGGAGALSWPEILFRIVAAALVVVAFVAGINVRRLNLLYLLTFVLTIALGLRYLGVLLMGALIITPAATTKRLAKNLTQMLLIAVGVAVAATVVGI
jgi:ABC-type Mn2+/Zn2+ transport system permease subunit